MNSTNVIPPRSETLVSGQQKIWDRVETILEKRLRPLARNISTQWSWGQFEDIMDRLLAVLSVIYFMGAAGLAGILLLKAFSP